MIGKGIPPAPVTGASATARLGSDIRPAPDRFPAEEPQLLLQALLETLPDAVFLIDRASMTFVDVNPAACRSLGYSREELLAMGPHQITTPGPRRGLEAEFDNVIRDGAPAAVRRASHRRKSGQRFAVQWFLRAVQHNSGQLLVLVAREVPASREALARAAGASGMSPDGGAACDSLTGLPGRHAFQQRLEHALETAHSDPA